MDYFCDTLEFDRYNKNIEYFLPSFNFFDPKTINSFDFMRTIFRDHSRIEAN